jgi:hypothetical protein
VKIGTPLQLALLGPNKVKVMVPVGLAPPLKVAESLIIPPSAIAAEAFVATLDDAGTTVTWL